MSYVRLKTGDIIQSGDVRVASILGAGGKAWVAPYDARGLGEALGTPVQEGEWFERPIAAEEA